MFPVATDYAIFFIAAVIGTFTNREFTMKTRKIDIAWAIIALWAACRILNWI